MRLESGAMLLLAAVALSPAYAFDWDDPFGNDSAVSSMPARNIPCSFPEKLSGIALSEIVDRALCNNPQTREAWANARAQAAQVGVAQSAYLPTINATGSITRNSTTSGVVGINRVGAGGNTLMFTQKSYGLSLGYTLYDFGARAAQLDNAEQLLRALNLTQDSVLQSVFLSAVQAYYQLLTADALVESSRDAAKASEESFRAADARYQVGTVTLADKLQAKTAYSQAVVTLIKAEGDAKIARGVLLNAMGMSPDLTFSLSPAPPVLLEQIVDIDKLIDEAKALRPDLAAAQAQVDAARAGVDAARASGLPVISLNAGRNYGSTTFTTVSRTDSLGVQVNFPLFTGFNTTSRIRGAQALVAVKMAQKDKLDQQVALDVWRAYQNLNSQRQALGGTKDLVDSATQAEKMAAGRYQGGLGNILDVLNAQSALANARQQYIQAQYNWRIAKATLAQAMGMLDLSKTDKAY